MMPMSSSAFKKKEIKPAKKMFNFNSRSFKRAEKRMLRHLDGYGRRSLLERIFPRRYNNFWWKGTHNGVYGPGGHTTWEFRSGNLALVIAIATAIGFILYMILS